MPMRFTNEMFKDNQGLEGLVALPRAGNLYIKGGKRIKPKRSDFRGCCRKCEKMFVDWLCENILPSAPAGGKTSNPNVEMVWTGRLLGKQSIITAIKTMRRVILVLRSVQPDGNRSSSLVLSDGRGCGQRGRHG